MSLENKITACFAYDEAYSELGDFTYDHNSKGLTKRGIQCTLDRDPLSDRPRAWDKILILLRELETSDYAIWVDSDIVIKDFDRFLSFIDRMESEDKTFVFSSDYRNTEGVNTGIMFVKSCEQAFDFLYNVWAQEQYVDPPTSWWEQCAIMHVLGYTGGWRRPVNKTYDPVDKFKSVNRRTKWPQKRNAFLGTSIISPSGELQADAFATPGDYPDACVVHACGQARGSLEERKHTLQSWLT